MDNHAQPMPPKCHIKKVQGLTVQLGDARVNVGHASHQRYNR